MYDENYPDYVKIVRCKNCRYYEPPDDYEEEEVCGEIVRTYFNGGYCRKNGDDFVICPNTFCCWGQTKLSREEIERIYKSLSNDVIELVELGIFTKEEICYVIKAHEDEKEDWFCELS